MQRELEFGWFLPTSGDTEAFGEGADTIPSSMAAFEETTRAAEEAGFSYLLVPVQTLCWEAWVTSAMIVGRSQSIRPLIAARPGYIQPTLLAKMISTFDQLSGGRLCINLIAGASEEERDGLELDWVAHDVAKFARLMTKRNGYVLEQLYSPLVVHGGPWLDELRTIGKGCVIRHLHHHYDGFASNQRKLLDGGEETVKRLLYCYRVLLTGIHVLRTGRIEANLEVLNDEHGLTPIADLIERKRSGQEKGALAEGEAASHGPTLDRLQAQLASAFETSTLPEEVTTFEDLDDFVVRARLELGDG